jgi:hypothetical protein
VVLPGQTGAWGHPSVRAAGYTDLQKTYGTIQQP